MKDNDILNELMNFMLKDLENEGYRNIDSILDKFDLLFKGFEETNNDDKVPEECKRKLMEVEGRVKEYLVNEVVRRFGTLNLK